ncbi:hypothetical protein [Pseudoleptotrichia goodfellowii]|uniref:Lipoprotein n=1 Tax=Pseudoleptotrichia goodfellowii F0264 TaxID=596323 RepID=D0GP11_9FUSO|nr:hypothetical protein [Pseudoleptotrichia goodfellowii]EEY34170.1 hypothetical protein HMPREF0554_2156 [Pseudoleptotrichia goodfellowii F0264]
MKKNIILILSLIILSSCITDMSQLTGPIPKKGYSDYGAEFTEKDILERRKVVAQISGYNIKMPENMIFKYGKSATTDELFGKKRKYLYDEVTKTGTSVFLIEESIEKMKEYEKKRGGSYIFSEERKRYNIRISILEGVSVMIEIKPGLYIACEAEEIGSMKAVPVCEAIVKVMKSQ